MGLASAFGLGWLIGSIVIVLIFRAFIFGTLHIVTSEDEPYMFLELSKDVNAVSKKTHVMFKVNTKDVTSRQ